MKNLSRSLGSIAKNLPDYFEKIRRAEFQLCHLNEDWIASQCNEGDLIKHQKFLMEYAAEVLISNSPASVLSDEYICESSWLNDLKNERRLKYGDANELFKNSSTRHLIEISPGKRAFVRMKEFVTTEHIEQRRKLIEKYERRRALELTIHNELICVYLNKMPKMARNYQLQAFFAECMYDGLRDIGAILKVTKIKDAFGQDKEVIANLIKIKEEFVFCIFPLIISIDDTLEELKSGRQGFRFAVSSLNKNVSENTEFENEVVIRLSILFPNQFSGYSDFENPQTFCLNIAAWLTLLRIVLPDVLDTLRNSELKNS